MQQQSQVVPSKPVKKIANKGCCVATLSQYVYLSASNAQSEKNFEFMKK